METMTVEQKDALKEVVNVGSGTAATALSQMLGQQILIEVPRVEFLEIEDAYAILGLPEEMVVVVYLKVLGDISGVILLSFKKSDAIHMCDLLLGQKVGKTKIIGEMAQSALKETGTILSGAYLSAISKLLDTNFLISTPALTQDMAGAVFDNILIETSLVSNNAIAIHTELTLMSESIKACFFFVPDTPSLQKVLDKLGLG